MSFVQIPGPYAGRGRPDFFTPSRVGGPESIYANPPANNQTLGWQTNDRMVMGFAKYNLGKKSWNESILRDSFVFLLKDPAILPPQVSKSVRYANTSVREKSVLLTLQQANFLLANGADKLPTVEKVYQTICPLGVNTTAEAESSLPRPVMNIVVGGNVEHTFNLWGNKYPAMAHAYFAIKKVRIGSGQSLKFILSNNGTEIEHVHGGADGKYVYQLVPWVSTDGREPMLKKSIEGFFKVGSLVQPSALKDVASSDKYDNADDRISRDMPELVAKSRMVKLFVNIY